MKIGVVFTGGTIGSRLDQDGYIGTRQDMPYLLLEKYKERCNASKQKEEITFVKRNPYTILSENLSGKELEKLISCVLELLHQKELEGIIITHGTDSLQYAAAVLGYVFSQADIPIVLVSSNYVLEDSRANGLTNFYYGVEFIKGKYGKGVYVSYCNHKSVPEIHVATRLNMPVYYSDELRSIEDSIFGYFPSEKKFCYAEESSRTKTSESSVLFSEKEIKQIHLSPCQNEIMVIHPFVGMQYPNLSQETKIILHGSFHSGTIAITEDLRRFAQKARAMGIPFYLIGLSAAVNHYETVQSYKELDIYPLYDRGLIAQYCKAWLIVSNGLSIRENMEAVMAWEQAGQMDMCERTMNVDK